MKNAAKPSSTAVAYGAISRTRRRVRNRIRLDHSDSRNTHSSSEPSCEDHAAVGLVERRRGRRGVPGDDVEGEVRAQERRLEDRERDRHQPGERVHGAAAGVDPLAPAVRRPVERGARSRRARRAGRGSAVRDRPAPSQPAPATISTTSSQPGTWMGTWWSASSARRRSSGRVPCSSTVTSTPRPGRERIGDDPGVAHRDRDLQLRVAHAEQQRVALRGGPIRRARCRRGCRTARAGRA